MFRIPGAPSVARVEATRAGAQLVKGASFKYNWQAPRNAPNVGTDFPIVPTPSDVYDDTANIKAVYANPANIGVGQNWVVPFEQADAQYLLRKRDMEENAEFDAWLYNRYDLTDPAQNLMLQQIAPELYKRREEVIDYNQDLASRYAKLRLRGPKSEEDFRFEWLVETGRIELPKGPVWSPFMWRQYQSNIAGNDAVAVREDERWQESRYINGLFSPIKFLYEGIGGRQPNPNNRFDIAGNAYQKYNSINAPYPDAAYTNNWARPYSQIDTTFQLRPQIVAPAPPPAP